MKCQGEYRPVQGTIPPLLLARRSLFPYLVSFAGWGSSQFRHTETSGRDESGNRMPDEETMDKFDEIFAMQKELNEYICRKRDLGDDLWDRFTAKDASSEEQRDWTLNYSRAMIHEAAELADSCDWKWWSDDPPIDLQNARVEVIDLWHFLISASMVVGLTADDVLDLYRQKHAINKQRQQQGYSRETKTEDDNRTIAG